MFRNKLGMAATARCGQRTHPHTRHINSGTHAPVRSASALACETEGSYSRMHACASNPPCGPMRMQHAAPPPALLTAHGSAREPRTYCWPTGPTTTPAAHRPARGLACMSSAAGCPCPPLAGADVPATQTELHWLRSGSMLTWRALPSRPPQSRPARRQPS